jgi:adenosine deaminase
VTTAVDASFVRHIPKAEVHVHLEGCFEPAAIGRLATAAGETTPRPLGQLYDMRGLDLSAFLEVLDWSCGLVRTRAQLEETAYAFALRESRAGVGYADVIVNPTHWSAWRHRLDEFVDSLARGLQAAEVDRLTVVNLCFSLLRQQSTSEAIELVEWLLERQHPRVVALSIDGNEAAVGRTGPRFAEAFRRAREAGLRRTVHAGESSGPEGVWDALEYLHAERIDHGVRAIEDPALVRELATRQVPIGVCPGSNIRLGLYSDLHSHPLDSLRRAGVAISINTDDPALLSTDLVSEYVACAEAYGWDRSTVRQLAGVSLEASFAPPELKRHLRERLEAVSTA